MLGQLAASFQNIVAICNAIQSVKITSLANHTFCLCVTYCFVFSWCAVRCVLCVLCVMYCVILFIDKCHLPRNKKHGVEKEMTVE